MKNQCSNKSHDANMLNSVFCHLYVTSESSIDFRCVFVWLSHVFRPIYFVIASNLCMKTYLGKFDGIVFITKFMCAKSESNQQAIVEREGEIVLCTCGLVSCFACAKTRFTDVSFFFQFIRSHNFTQSSFGDATEMRTWVLLLYAQTMTFMRCKFH